MRVLGHDDVHLHFHSIVIDLFIYLAHSMQPKTPMVEMRPYKIFGICAASWRYLVPASHELYGSNETTRIHSASSHGSRFAHRINCSTIRSTFPAAVVDMRLSTSSKHGKRSQQLLSDLTEVRKTGLSPEKCIESLSTRDYGAFSKELRKISSEISWGIPVKRVIVDFLSRTRSWLMQIVMFLLVETIDVGGGTIAMIESLTRFNNLTQDVEKEKKMSVRPYVMMPYLASIFSSPPQL